ncbi:hypothetical protein Pelo_6 [Pelomyxa schiedti]|nr:hypothetical protein Pelo_6 [Pelomyxa schiedti]
MLLPSSVPCEYFGSFKSGSGRNSSATGSYLAKMGLWYPWKNKRHTAKGLPVLRSFPPVTDTATVTQGSISTQHSLTSPEYSGALPGWVLTSILATTFLVLLVQNADKIPPSPPLSNQYSPNALPSDPSNKLYSNCHPFPSESNTTVPTSSPPLRPSGTLPRNAHTSSSSLAPPS